MSNIAVLPRISPPTDASNVIRLPAIRAGRSSSSHHSTETVRLQIVRETTSIALEISRR
jgi:hypothetical protein